MNSNSFAIVKFCHFEIEDEGAAGGFHRDFLFANVVLRQDFRYSSWSYHLESIVGWLPCLLRLAFFSICFAL